MEEDHRCFLSLTGKELLNYVQYEKISARKILIPELPTSFNTPASGQPLLPKRKESKGELECKAVLEDYFNKEFNCHRPDFICCKKNLELDLFNPELGIACEYHGKQHCKYPSRFIKKKKVFLDQLGRDLYKLYTCKQLGIYVITVPYTCNRIREFLFERLDKLFQSQNPESIC